MRPDCARRRPCPLQSAVLHLRPEPAHVLDLYASGFGGITIAGQNMEVVIALVACAGLYRDIRCTAVAINQSLNKVAGQRLAAFDSVPQRNTVRAPVRGRKGAEG